MIGKVHHSTSLWRIWDPEFKAVKSQSEVISKKNGMHHEQLITDKNKEDMFGLKSNDSQSIKYLKADQPEADEIRDIATSGTGGGDSRGHTETTNTSGTGGGDSRGRTGEATNISGTGDGDIRGRTKTASGTDGSVSSSGHTRGSSRYAEPPNGAANDRGRTEAESDSEKG